LPEPVRRGGAEALPHNYILDPRQPSPTLRTRTDMSYDNTTKPSASFGGAIFFLMLLMVAITVTIFSTGMIGSPERRAKVFVPVTTDTVAKQK
jgi:hypothetical protein